MIQLRYLIFLFVLSCFSTTLPVQRAFSAQTDSVIYTDPEELLLNLLDKVNELSEQDISTAERIDALHDIIVVHFDINKISNFFLGRYRKKISSELKKEFTDIILEHLLLTFYPRLEEHLSKANLQLKKATTSNRGYHTITSEYTGQNKQIIKVAWIMVRNKTTGSYKIFDVKIEGVSYILSLRDQYQSVLRRKGIDGLINQLTQLINKKKTEMGLE